MRSITFLFLWLLVFIMPWEGMFAIPGLTSTARIIGLAAFLSGVVSVLVSGRWRFPFALVWVALFSGWCAVSTQWSLNPDKALLRAQQYVLLLTFVWLVCKFADNPKRLKWLIRACLLGTTMIIVNQCLSYVHAGVALQSADEERFTAEAVDANVVATFCSLGILFAFYLITRREKTGFELPNWLYWGFIVAAALANLLTGSRGGAISLGIASLVLLARFWKVTWKARLGLIAAVALVVVLVPRLVSRSTFERIAEGTSAATFQSRVISWQTGLRAWSNTPVVGVGVGSYLDINRNAQERVIVAHNTVVSVLVESGLVGFTLYFLFWGFVIRRIMLFSKADRFFWFGLLAAYLPQFLAGSEEYSKLSWFLARWCCASRRSRVRPRRKSEGPLRPLFEGRGCPDSPGNPIDRRHISMVSAGS